MKRFVLRNKEGKWPGIAPLFRIRVQSVCLNPTNRDLVLTMKSGDTLIFPSPWHYVSCLTTVSSEEFSCKQSSGNQDPIDMSSICIGLEGAKLTEVESDSAHLDLLFDSIRISLKQKTPK